MTAPTPGRRRAATSPAAAAATTDVGSTPQEYDWYLTSLVQSWVNGSVPNDGLLLKATDEATNNELNFYGLGYGVQADEPTLNVIYQQWVGNEPWFTYEGRQLTDRLDLSVNPSCRLEV